MQINSKLQHALFSPNGLLIICISNERTKYVGKFLQNTNFVLREKRLDFQFENRNIDTRGCSYFSERKLKSSVDWQIFLKRKYSTTQAGVLDVLCFTFQLFSSSVQRPEKIKKKHWCILNWDSLQCRSTLFYVSIYRCPRRLATLWSLHQFCL